ncbi:hypothetical protein [Flavobacterium hiemivividum]|uniref:GOLD domain-containing protein n=1 Tax=Flavobacterium hiemivividum TaxID=2541734 RepID=A0A4V2Z1H9_9FLAO|nr:hypothetical protein [Flavobacterium hiemivividum]TDE04898.1 hypothetical protein E0F98_06025 [Flavobacterium hiemivividum]
MKNLRLKAAALVLFVTAGLASCSNDDDTPTIVTKKTFVTEVTGPTTAKLNEEIALEVTYAVENNCGVFNKFIETSAEKTKTIEVETKQEGTTCDTTPATKKTTYKFKAATEGTYILNFKKSETEFVTQTITVSAAS